MEIISTLISYSGIVLYLGISGYNFWKSYKKKEDYTQDSLEMITNLSEEFDKKDISLNIENSDLIFEDSQGMFEFFKNYWDSIILYLIISYFFFFIVLKIFYVLFPKAIGFHFWKVLTGNYFLELRSRDLLSKRSWLDKSLNINIGEEKDMDRNVINFWKGENDYSDWLQWIKTPTRSILETWENGFGVEVIIDLVKFFLHP